MAMDFNCDHKFHIFGADWDVKKWPYPDYRNSLADDNAEFWEALVHIKGCEHFDHYMHPIMDIASIAIDENPSVPEDPYNPTPVQKVLPPVSMIITAPQERKYDFENGDSWWNIYYPNVPSVSIEIMDNHNTTYRNMIFGKDKGYDPFIIIEFGGELLNAYETDTVRDGKYGLYACMPSDGVEKVDGIDYTEGDEPKRGFYIWG